VIEDAVPRQGRLRFLRAVLETVACGLPTIRGPFNVSDYPLVILGTPVWAGSMASPMRSFLVGHQRELRHVACFCTMAGHGDQSTLREMAALCRKADAPTFSCTEAEVRAGRHRQRLEQFVRTLRSVERGRAAA
jgi:menaquinone-dependent protoporphyrinogen IX oxidase